MRNKPTRRPLAFFVLFAAAALLPSCTLYSTAQDWSHLKGENGERVWLKTGTNVGFNILIFIPLPLLGSTSITPMVRDVTQDIADEGGDHVRIVESNGENYWYGFPPFTWFVTPVITTVSAEYRPDLVRYMEKEDELRARSR